MEPFTLLLTAVAYDFKSFLQRKRASENQNLFRTEIRKGASWFRNKTLLHGRQALNR